VHPGCTGTANRIPTLALIAGSSGSRFDDWTNPTRGDDGFVADTAAGVSSPDDVTITTMV
jgi:hypothetical protein